MEWLKTTGLAWLRWAWDHFTYVLKMVWAKLGTLFDTVIDPPARTIRFYFWSVFAAVVCLWITFAFVNSWFYKPTVEFVKAIEIPSVLTGDDGDVDIVRLQPPAPLPPVAQDEPEVAEEEMICLDASDTPHCVPKSELEKKEEPVVEELPEIVVEQVKPEPTFRKNRKVRVRKVKPFKTYWGY